MIAFGPIPSRRLGKSLGINHIPPKQCSYDCVYCQVGRTNNRSINRRAFYEVEEVMLATKKRIQEVKAGGGSIDYITLVPDGEPTLDIHLGDLIRSLKYFEIPVAVISNSSMMWRTDVRRELDEADLVSLKIDTINEHLWRKINRPNAQLSLNEIMEGIMTFAESFQGTLITETMLVEGINDDPAAISATASFLEHLSLDKAYLAIPTRPTVENWAHAPGEELLNRAYQLFNLHLDQVELLTGFSPLSFETGSGTIENLLDITSVHPMREQEVYEFLSDGGLDMRVVDDLVAQHQLVRIFYDGQPFYIRKMQSEVAAL